MASALTHDPKSAEIRDQITKCKHVFTDLRSVYSSVYLPKGFQSYRLGASLLYYIIACRFKCKVKPLKQATFFVSQPSVGK